MLVRSRGICRSSRTLQVPGLGCSTACRTVVPQSGIEPTSHALSGRFWTSGPAGKSLIWRSLLMPQIKVCLPSLLRIPTQFLLLGSLQIVAALLLKHPPFRWLYYHTSGKVAVHYNHFEQTWTAFRSLWQYTQVLVWAVSTYGYFQQGFPFGDFVLKFFGGSP